MDFFERQDKARKQSKVLVGYFVLAVAGIVISVYIASLLIFFGAQSQQAPGTSTDPLTLWNPELFLLATLVTVGVIVAGSLYKTAALARGGSAVAEALGGRLLDPNTTNPDERKLHNVIEEMAIASGVPVPAVYVLDEETGVNAFAAGHTPDDAAIGVTLGCMTLLNRDELQGVIAHEFSHILNGDMRLNLRLMGIIFGILCLTVIGRVLLYSRSRDNRGKNPMMILGIALLVIGAIGVFFGRLIQAALSRQREFLADASAIQFTRNPAGLSGALQKIGGAGSQLSSAHAGEASHMFFGNGLSQSFFGMLATHPPLDDRIRAIDPAWDGEFKPLRKSGLEVEPPPKPKKARSSRLPVPPIPGIPAGSAGAAGFAASVVQTESVLPNLGEPTSLHLRYAVDLRNAIPEDIRDVAHEPRGATAVIYAILLSKDEACRKKELAEIARRMPGEIADKTTALWPKVSAIASHARLPLVNLALPALRQLKPEDVHAFTEMLHWLMESDQQIDLFEYVLHKIVRRHLILQSEKTRSMAIKYHKIKPLVQDCRVVLSALANVSSTDMDEVAKAFQTGSAHLQTAGELRILPYDECGLKKIDNALDRLALAAPQIKKQVIEACVYVVGADGFIQEREAELLRAIAETLACPIPPFVTILDADESSI